MTAAPRLAHLRGDASRVILYGHRGARGVLPENTLPGFCHLADLGISAVEFDVLVTSDGVAVLTHNPLLSPDTTRGPNGAWLAGPGPAIVDTPLEALQRYDVGAIRAGTDYAARFPDQTGLTGVAIPTLESFCVWAVAQRDMALMVEIKSAPTQPGLTPEPPDLVRATLGPLRAHGLLGRSVLQSFDWRVLEAASVQVPGVARSYLSRIAHPGATFDANIYPGSVWMNGIDPADHGNSLPQAVARNGGHMWCPYFEDLTQDELDHAHALGLVVNVWTVNTPDDLRRLAEMGVDGIITDYPARAQTVLGDMGLAWGLAADTLG